MAFPHTTSRGHPLRIHDLLVLVALSALPMAGARSPSGVAGFAAVMLALGLLLWWLPRLGGRGQWTDLFILPAFMGLTFFYLFLSMVIFFSDPNAAISIVGAQLIALVYVSFRA
jgi:hypothetical protein